MKKLLASFLLSLILLTTATYAQIKSAVVATISRFAGVIFILIFVLILLAIGGVLHLPRGTGRFLPITIFAILVFLLPYILVTYFSDYFPSYTEVPKSFKIEPLPAGATRFFVLMGLPAEWGYVPAILYLFILPFAGIYTLVWGFLTVLNIFPSPNINKVLALVITFITIPVGWFVKMVWLLFAGMGAWSVAVFTLMFVAGVLFRGAGVAAKTYAEYRKYVGLRGARISDLIGKLKALEKADAKTIQDELPTIMAQAGDLITVQVATHLQSAIDAAKGQKTQDAQKLIRQARKLLEKIQG